MAQKPSIDGFIPRRMTGHMGEYHPGFASSQKKPEGHIGQTTPVASAAPTTGLAPSGLGLSRSDIDESLRQIDDAPLPKTKKHRRYGFKANRRKIIKRVILVLAALVAAVGIFLGVKAFLASNSIFKGGLFGLIQSKELQMDSNGRSNILVLGTSEDDPGHQGAYLTDSMMIVSIDQKNKNAYMISVPRDLWVQYGQACPAGYAGKINAYFSCVNEDMNSSSAEDQRQTAERKFVGDIFGLDIQYSVHVNYTVMRDLVGAVGPITVDIKGDGANGIMDSNFDWKCGATYYARLQKCPPDGHYIQYPNGPATLDAEHVLYLAMARGDVAPTYGLASSDFDRQQNQQKIILAIRQKALSGGTLADVGKVTKLIDALGNNLRTNFETSEVRTLLSLAQDIPSSSIKTVDLFKSGHGVLGTGPINGQSVVVPYGGTFNYSSIRAYVKQQLSSDPMVQEQAHVMVLNGSGATGVAQNYADQLTGLGMSVDSVGNAPTGTYAANQVYEIGTGKPKSAEKLSIMFNTTPLKTTPPVTAKQGIDFVIIVVKAP